MRPYAGSGATRTIRFPTLSPARIPTSARGADSRPSTMSSSTFSSPDATHAASCSWAFIHSPMKSETRKPFHAQSLDDELAGHAGGPRRRRRAVVLRDRPAADDPPVRAHQRQHRLEHAAADVVEVDVDALRARLGEVLAQLLAAVVHGRLEPEVTLEHAVLLVRAA